MIPFDRSRWLEDDNAKTQIGKWLARDAWYQNVKVNPDRYGIDLLATQDGVRHGFEIEVKHAWTGDQFPYNRVHVPYRKHKVLTQAEQVHIIMLNLPRTRCLWITGQHLIMADTVHVDTKYGHDRFYTVPLDWCQMFDLTMTHAHAK